MDDFNFKSRYFLRTCARLSVVATSIDFSSIHSYRCSFQESTFAFSFVLASQKRSGRLWYSATQLNAAVKLPNLTSASVARSASFTRSAVDSYFQ